MALVCTICAGAAWAESPWPVLQEREASVEILRQAGATMADAPLEKYTTSLEKLRGHAFQGRVAWKMHTPEEVRQFLKVEMVDGYPEKQSQLDSAYLKLLGLVPADFKIRAFVEDLLTEQIAGAYDPKTKHFFLVRSEGGLGSKLLQAVQDFDVLAVHELDHALQDQLFDLLSLEKRMKTWSTDQQMAAQSVFEGEATLVMTDYSLRSTGHTADDQNISMAAMADVLTMLPGLPGMGSFSEAPSYYKRSLIFPYYVGMDFVREVRRAGGWELVDRIYKHLPRSTEQVLHPEKYFQDEPPRAISLSRLPSQIQGWTRMGDDSGGEFLVRVVVEQHQLGRRDSVGAGWGGDRFRVYRKGESTCLVWVSDWDTPADAKEFAAAMTRKTGWVVRSRNQRVVVLVDAPPELIPLALQTP